MSANLEPYSVVMPTYNYARYLPQSLGSVLGQTHPPAQVIVIDDGSTDDTPQAMAQYAADARVEYVHQPNMGIAATQNRGMKLARHSYLAFLDADDYWLPHKIELQMAVLRERPEIDLVYTHADQFISPDAITPERWRLDEANQQLAGVITSCVLLRRAAAERIGPFDVTLRRAQYLDWHTRAVTLGLHWHVLPDVLVHRRIHGRNASILFPDHQREYLEVARTQMMRRRLSADSRKSE